MKIEIASNKNGWLNKIGKWYFDEWGKFVEDKTLEIEIEKVRLCIEENGLPLMLIAHENENLLGVAQLRTNEMKLYPSYEYWLGGVYVAKKVRGKGIASIIIKEVIAKAKELNVEKIYLQTEKLEGGLYAKLGWSAIEQVTYEGAEVLVMENIITADDN